MIKESFCITATKENSQIRLKFGGANFSKAECMSAFWAIDEKLELLEDSYNFISLPNGSLTVKAVLPDDEPWKTNVEILSNGFAFEEISNVVSAAKKQLAEFFKSIPQ